MKAWTPKILSCAPRCPRIAPRPPESPKRRHQACQRTNLGTKNQRSDCKDAKRPQSYSDGQWSGAIGRDHSPCAAPPQGEQGVIGSTRRNFSMFLFHATNSKSYENAILTATQQNALTSLQTLCKSDDPAPIIQYFV